MDSNTRDSSVLMMSSPLDFTSDQQPKQAERSLGEAIGIIEVFVGFPMTSN